jgi:hypothetical protein
VLYCQQQRRKCLLRIAERGERKSTTIRTHFRHTLSERKLKVKKEGNAKSTAKKCRAPSGKGDFADLHEDSAEIAPCGFCGLKYCSVESVQNCDLIRCQKYDTLSWSVCWGWRQKAVQIVQLWFCSIQLNEQNSHTDERNSSTIIDITIYCIIWYVL